MERFWSKVSKDGECWEWMASRNEDGYGWFRFNGRPELAHRISWMLANGYLPDSEVKVRHTCDNPGCVNPKHLILGTQADNNRDKALRRRAPSDLLDDEVVRIRDLYATKRHSQRALADMFGTSQQHVSRLVRRTRRREVC